MKEDLNVPQLPQEIFECNIEASEEQGIIDRLHHENDVLKVENEKLKSEKNPPVVSNVSGKFESKDMIAFGEFIRTNYFVDGSPKMISYNPAKYPHGTIEKIFELWITQMAEIKPANTVKVIQIETTCLKDGLILDECKYQDGVRIGSYACSMCENYMKESKRFYNTYTFLTHCSKYTEEQAKAQNLKYSIV